MQDLDFNFKETPKATVHKGLQHFLHTLNLSDGQFQLASRTILFSDKNQKEVHTFLETVMKLSHFSINLRDTEEATKQINQYIEKETQGKTVGLVQDLDKDTTLVLVNYIFFHGKFYHQSELVQKETHKNILKHLVCKLSLAVQDIGHRFSCYSRFPTHNHSQTFRD